MKSATKSLSLPKSKHKTSPWEKAAGLLKSKKSIVLRELAQNRKSWGIKPK